MQIPQRPSLVAQVTEILRLGIHSGEWSQRLPSEVALCSRLQVSRRTLRAALSMLQREGLLKVRYGKGRDICAPSRPRIKRSASKLIGILYCPPTPIISRFGDPFLGGIEVHLHAAGYGMALVPANVISRGKRLQNSLERLVQQTNAACWLLRSAPADVQRWFAERQIPTILAGTTHEGIHLPAFDIDFRAVCRHAAKVFSNLGHRRAALLAPKTGFAGDLNSAMGFSEAFGQRADAKPAARVVYHDGTVACVRRALGELFNVANAPTAILVSRSVHALTVFSHLLKSGRNIPGDVSLISRDDDEFLGAVTPSIARYVSNWNVHGKHLARAILQLARAGTLTPRQVLFFPQFQKGETLAPPKS